MWDEITYTFVNFNGAIVEVQEWINNFISHFAGHFITYPCWDQYLTMVINQAPECDKSHEYSNSLFIHIFVILVKHLSLCSTYISDIAPLYHPYIKRSLVKWWHGSAYGGFPARGTVMQILEDFWEGVLLHTGYLRVNLWSVQSQTADIEPNIYLS